MADELTPKGRQIVLLALWNHKLARAQLPASANLVGASELSKRMTLVADIDRLAGHRGGDRYAPAYGRSLTRPARTSSLPRANGYATPAGLPL